VRNEDDREEQPMKWAPISAELGDLLRSKGNHHLSEDEVMQAGLHAKMIVGWAEKVPPVSVFFFDEPYDVVLAVGKSSLTKEEIGIAVYLQPLHSAMCAIALLALWKSEQLIRGLFDAMNKGQFIAAATLARGLVEISAAFGVETHGLGAAWRERKARSAPNAQSLTEFSNQCTRMLAQTIFGTRQKASDGSLAAGIQRTNIVTLIKKAEKLSSTERLLQFYEVLCDTVHPSMGSNRTFFTQELQKLPGSPRVGFRIERRASALLGDLPYVTAKTSLWAMQWLGQMWTNFELARNDFFLTTKLYALPGPRYFGVISPDRGGEYCACGNGQQKEKCLHRFGGEG